MSRAGAAVLLSALGCALGCTDSVRVFEAESSDGGMAPPRDAGADARPAQDAGRATGSARVLAAFEQTCVVNEDGLYCWGRNRAGQVGVGALDAGVVGRPERVEAAADYVEICAGEEHTCGLRGDGVLDCWGGNVEGQLGQGDRMARASPTALSGAPRFLSVACGGNITCALAEEGALYCWGNNSEGALGQGEGADVGTVSTVPLRVPLGRPARQVSVGQGHVCALVEGGAVFCWGRNKEVQLGVGAPAVEQQIQTPMPVVGGGSYLHVSAGQTFTCAVRADRRLFCWGTDTNLDGRLGLGRTRFDVTEPTQVGEGDDYREVHIGWFHSCALQAQGQLSCWGRNDEGQLGLDDVSQRFEPQVVAPGGPPWDALAVGRFHTCGLRAGAVYCWGENRNFQQLGLGDTERRYVPTLVPLP